MFLALDCLKFYKLKSEGTVRSLFVILYLMFLAFDIFPIGEVPDYAGILVFLQSGSNADFPEISTGNLYYVLSLLVFSLITSLFSVVYATAFVSEKEGFPARKGIVDTLRKIPQLFGFILILVVPAMISSVFIFIPLIYLYYSLFVAPILITEGKMGIFSAMSESLRSTRGYKFSIFFTQIVVNMIINIPVSIFEMGFIFGGQGSYLASSLVLSFFRASRVLVIGRLIGHFYIMIVKQRKDVLSVPVADEGKSPAQDSNDNDTEAISADKV